MQYILLFFILFSQTQYFHVITNQTTENGLSNQLPVLDLSVGGTLYVIGGNVSDEFAYVQLRQYDPVLDLPWIDLFRTTQVISDDPPFVYYIYTRLFSAPMFTERPVGHVVQTHDTGSWLYWYNILRSPDIFGHFSSIAHSDISQYWHHPYMEPTPHFAYRHPFPAMSSQISNVMVVEFRLVDGDFISPSQYMLVYY